MAFPWAELAETVPKSQASDSPSLSLETKRKKKRGGLRCLARGKEKPDWGSDKIKIIIMMMMMIWYLLSDSSEELESLFPSAIHLS
jgi:hypothetical protein